MARWQRESAKLDSDDPLVAGTVECIMMFLNASGVLEGADDATVRPPRYIHTRRLDVTVSDSCRTLPYIVSHPIPPCFTGCQKHNETSAFNEDDGAALTHELVDGLSEDHVEAAERYLRWLRNQDDPVIRRVRAAPVDDEALGDEDRKAMDDGRRDIAAGSGIPEDKFAASGL